MKRILITLAAAIVVAGGLLTMGLPRARAQQAVDFPPQLTWFNVQRPLNWSDLEGRAVLLDFFTPGCINCIHMLPVEKRLERHFGTRLVVVGIDSPKFAASKTKAGLQSFIERYGLGHPIVLDPDLGLWHAYGVQAWPTLILIGPHGRVPQQFIGEQSFEQLAQPIDAALAGAPAAAELPKLPLLPAALQPHALTTPSGIAVSKTLVAVADTAHNRIVLATHAGKLVATVGNGCAGDANGDYDHAEFDRPHGLASHDGALYVADTGNQLIRRIDLVGHRVTTIAGNGLRRYASAGSAPALEAPLNSPWDLAWAAGDLYISMAGDHQIWRLDPSTGHIGPWAGTGQEGLEDGSRQQAEFAQPSGLSLHGDVLYDADPESSSIRAITVPAGEVSTLLGHGLFDFGMRNGTAGHALLQHAEGLAWHADSLYVADTYNDALRRLDLATRKVTTVAALLDRPVSVAVLAPNVLLVAEANGDRIDAVHLPGGKVTPWPIQGLQVPHPDACHQ